MDRHFIITDKNGLEKCWLPETASLDFEISTDSSDVQLTLPAGIAEIGDFLICPGTEYGAALEQMVITTSHEFVTFYGNSFRKLLDQVVICPDAGQDYKTVSGDVNSILRTLMAGQLGGFFHVTDTNVGITVNNHQFKRYCTILEGMSDLLSGVGAKLHINIVQGASNSPFYVTLEALPVVNWSDQYEYSEDSKITVTLNDNRRGVNHLICLGRGELKDRQVLHLYAWADGSVKTSPYYTGFAERQAVYDNSGAESLEDLRKGGIQKMVELGNAKSVNVAVQDVELDVGDIVSGRSYLNGVSVQEPITSKIIKIDDGEMTIEYKTGGD